MKKRVLILCTGNSCRSQMAEALWRNLAGQQWECHSAGSKPTGFVHPLAIETLAKAGLDISNMRSKGLDAFSDMSIDLVITVCDSAKQSCPVLAGARENLHWPFDDPADFDGDEEQQLAGFCRVRDEIREKIVEYLRVGDHGEESHGK